jgi:hypothetical protein
MDTRPDQYKIDQYRRDALLRAARREHLIRIAIAQKPRTPRTYYAALITLLQSLTR